MGIHYYLDWFYDGFPEKLSKIIGKDIIDRKSLVMITGDPLLYEDEMVGAAENLWLNKAGILFDAYHCIDLNMDRAKAQKIAQKASVIFLLGGYTIEQNNFLREYGLGGVNKGK